MPTALLKTATCGALLLAGCAHDRPRNETLRLRIENVQSQMGDIDPSEPPPQGSLFCALLGTAVSLATDGIGGAVTSVCDSMSSNGRRSDRRAEAPDITIGLKIGNHVVYRSPTNYNTISASSGHSFAIPLRALKPEGLFVIVEDEDEGGKSYEQLGSFRITKRELVGLRGRGLLRLAKEGPNTADLEVVVEKFVGATASRRLLASEGHARVDVEVPGGAVVEVRASGRYYVDSRGAMDPVGHVNGDGENYAVPPLATALHGAAFVAIGDGKDAKYFLVPSCVLIVGAPAGFVVVGINDNGNRTDNSGFVDFSVTVRSPAAEEWGGDAVAAPCQERTIRP